MGARRAAGNGTAPGRTAYRRGGGHGTRPGMVRFSEVGLRYPDPLGGSRETLRDLSFTLPQGSFTWLTGPSGAGKTSLLRLMQLAMRPTRGEVEVLGTPLSQARRGDLPALRRRIGAVFQEFRLLPYLTAFDNVALPLRLAGRTESSLRPDVQEMLRWVGLAGREEALPPQLSGGEQQRVAIARAVVTRPALLVADEPTGNLDPDQSRRLLMLLAEMNRLGATVIVATHNHELIAQHPGHVMVLQAGRIEALLPWPYADAAAPLHPEGGEAPPGPPPGPPPSGPPPVPVPPPPVIAEAAPPPPSRPPAPEPADDPRWGLPVEEPPPRPPGHVPGPRAPDPDTPSPRLRAAIWPSVTPPRDGDDPG
ncbi:cell division ATP-binding protein FtsE [Muricoccus radiodurans]|uniref:cell division ATP-binding protein FtsE n=1 Tax=Muricoccus radiodurans TaxID=2231721 RepID=UPI003CF7A20C